MTDDFATAMVALRGQGMNRALKTIEVMRDAVLDDFQRLIVIVSANFTLHNISLALTE
jgi:hypothetical protein